jgi:hypothetical protein
MEVRVESLESLAQRLNSLERTNHRLRVLLLLLVAISTGGAFLKVQNAGIMRVQGLIVEDESGTARMVLGRVDDHPKSTRGIGMRINDASGAERFGLTLNDAGAIGMGFDAPPGQGDERNRERINIVADEKGGAYLVMKDRRTGVVGRLYLDDQNRAWMQFSDFTQKPPVIRRWGLRGEEAVTSQ